MALRTNFLSVISPKRFRNLKFGTEFCNYLGKFLTRQLQNSFRRKPLNVEQCDFEPAITSKRELAVRNGFVSGMPQGHMK